MINFFVRNCCKFHSVYVKPMQLLLGSGRTVLNIGFFPFISSLSLRYYLVCSSWVQPFIKAGANLCTMIRLHQVHGNQWAKISKVIGRDPTSCCIKWNRLKWCNSLDQKTGNSISSVVLLFAKGLVGLMSIVTTHVFRYCRLACLTETNQ